MAGKTILRQAFLIKKGSLHPLFKLTNTKLT